MYEFCDKICKALAHKLRIHYDKDDEIDYDDMEYQANEINRHYDKDKSDDFGMER